MIIGVVAIYLGLVIVVGTLGHRLFRNTAEDYFVASRTIGPGRPADDTAGAPISRHLQCSEHPEKPIAWGLLSSV